MHENLKHLAEQSDWQIPEDQIQEIASLYAGTISDTRPVRELDLGSAVPAMVYKAEE
jgi:hypothetical protein